MAGMRDEEGCPREHLCMWRRADHNDVVASSCNSFGRLVRRPIQETLSGGDPSKRRPLSPLCIGLRYWRASE